MKYFSLVRDLVGTKEEEIELDSPTVAELLRVLARRHPKFGEWMKNEEVLVLVNGKPASQDKELTESDEIAVVPPLSGGSHARFTEKVNPSEELGNFIQSLPPEAGAVAVFVGIVKKIVNGKRVNELVYEAYEPHATHRLADIVSEELQKHDAITALVLHKVGTAKPGEPVLFIAVASKRRRESLEALSSILERVKREALVWKLERREDGEYWVLSDGRRLARER